MNTNTTGQAIFRMFRYTAAATIVATTVTAAPAFAEHQADEGNGPGYVTTFTIPFDAIGGRTMAQYVADVQAGNPRTHTVV